MPLETFEELYQEALRCILSPDENVRYLSLKYLNAANRIPHTRRKKQITNGTMSFLIALAKGVNNEALTDYDKDALASINGLEYTKNFGTNHRPYLKAFIIDMWFKSIKYDFMVEVFEQMHDKGDMREQQLQIMEEFLASSAKFLPEKEEEEEEEDE